MKKITVKKRQVLQKKGDLNTKIFQVESGLLRSYSIDEKGKEHIFMFGTEEWIIADIESNVFSKPTQLYIDTIEDSEIVVFSLDYLKTDQSTKEKLQKNSKLLSFRYRTIEVLAKKEAKKFGYNKS